MPDALYSLLNGIDTDLDEAGIPTTGVTLDTMVDAGLITAEHAMLVDLMSPEEREAMIKEELTDLFADLESPGK